MKSFVFVALLAAVAVAKAGKVDYSGHMIIRVVPQTESQLRHLMDLQNGPTSFFRSPSALGRPVDIHVSPQSYYELTHSLALKGLQHTITVADLGKRIEEEQKEIMLRRALNAGRAFDLQNYHTYAEIVAFLEESAKNHTTHASFSASIGTTSEGRAIPMLTIGAKSSPTKPAIYFDCGMHAREWIAPAVCLWIANELLTQYGSNSEITKLVDTYDWLMVPVQNPDGYEFTWTTNRLWRKNRQPNSGSTCVGTDANRNFNSSFGGQGASSDPCDETYHGPSAFSAPEAAAMRDVLKARSGHVKASFTIHSYSQLWMSPYGYKAAKPADYTEMNRVMKIGVDALTAAYGTTYKYGDIYSTIYQASGSTVDWTYDTEKILYSYALEMRDTGKYGFELPPSQIKPTSIETWDGIRAAIAAFK